MSLTQSPLHDRHVAAGAKFAGFGGWEMPLEYPTGVLKEHAAVRDSSESSTSAISARSPFAATERRTYLNRCLSNDLGPDRTGAGPVHPRV